jgi:predicted RNA-binding protein with PUA-like domain
MAYWLLKTEPTVYSWSDFVKDGKAAWDGIRSFPARLNLRKIAAGDTAFIYHSNVGKEIVGTATVTKAAYPDPKEPDWVIIDIKPDRPLNSPVTLAAIKKEKSLTSMTLLRQSRLSVAPMTAEEAKVILKMGSR